MDVLQFQSVREKKSQIQSIKKQEEQRRHRILWRLGAKRLGTLIDFDFWKIQKNGFQVFNPTATLAYLT